ncbi:FkbM family methyltransferase [Flavobacterium algicola]|uniref:FkbM family methyltransferase n=1 Tax=Flavobacterium algicola TaxID=556529 RepID=UPI001EFE60C3|nr:FkbM family methyltransferase [Flavobacterium algicola]MCG9793885.1 FkbM family methyltransferase [Flavobacterium algicola]
MNIKNLAKSLFGIGNIKLVKSLFLSQKERRDLVSRRIFYSQFLQPNSVFYDIGANFGNRIEAIIDTDITIIAVEPQVECIKFLRKKFGNKIILLQNGLGSKKEIMKMHIAPNANILSSFSTEWINSTKKSGRFDNIKWSETRDVEMITLDYLIEVYGKPDFVKIDVEGFELEVLKGLSQPVNMMSIEYTVPENVQALLDCLYYLNELYNSKIEFNYCITENMKFALPNWINYSSILDLIRNENFLNTQFGDIYVRYTFNS